MRYRLILKEEVDQNNLKTINNFLVSKCKNIGFGFLTKSGKYKFDDSEGISDYILQTPEQVSNSKLGVCWDVVEFEREFFEKNNIMYKTYCIIKGNNNDINHSFLVSKFNGKYYWIEGSMSNSFGINGPYNNLYSLFEEVSTNMSIDYPNERNLQSNVYEYNKPKYVIDRNTYLNFVRKNLVSII